MLHITPGLLQDFIFWLAVLTGGLLGGFTGFFLPEIAAGEIRDGRSLLRGAGAGLLHHWAAGQALPGAAALGVLHPARILGDRRSPPAKSGMGAACFAVLELVYCTIGLLDRRFPVQLHSAYFTLREFSETNAWERLAKLRGWAVVGYQLPAHWL